MYHPLVSHFSALIKYNKDIKVFPSHIYKLYAITIMTETELLITTFTCIIDTYGRARKPKKPETSKGLMQT